MDNYEDRRPLVALNRVLHSLTLVIHGCAGVELVLSCERTAVATTTNSSWHELERGRRATGFIALGTVVFVLRKLQTRREWEW